MAKLIYSAIASLDGYIADEDGNFDWAAPDEEVHRFVNDLARPVGTYLLGRRMYDTLAVWETMPTGGDQSPAMGDFAGIWRAADKVVYSRTLDTMATARTRIERDFDPDAVRRLKAQTERDIAVGGPDLAVQAIKAGLVDEFHLFPNEGWPRTQSWGQNIAEAAPVVRGHVGVPGFACNPTGGPG